MTRNLCKFSEIEGHTIESIVNESTRLVIQCDGGTWFELEHGQQCCEDVRIEDVTGDFEDLIGSPILVAEEATNADGPEPADAESYTWTFYKLATIKGYVTIRWLGESNGYYAEDVDCYRTDPTVVAR